jgi:hypothetical protein
MNFPLKGVSANQKQPPSGPVVGSCDCGEQMVIRTAKKNNSNFGRAFETCPQPRAFQCSRFRWRDDIPRNSGDVQVNPSVPQVTFPSGQQPAAQYASVHGPPEPMMDDCSSSSLQEFPSGEFGRKQVVEAGGKQSLSIGQAKIEINALINEKVDHLVELHASRDKQVWELIKEVKEMKENMCDLSDINAKLVKESIARTEQLQTVKVQLQEIQTSFANLHNTLKRVTDTLEMNMGMDDEIEEMSSPAMDIPMLEEVTQVDSEANRAEQLRKRKAHRNRGQQIIGSKKARGGFIVPPSSLT